MPRRVRLGLPIAPWFDAMYRSLKAQINRHIKYSLSLTQVKRDYKSYCKSCKRAYLKQRAQDMVDLIDSRKTDISSDEGSKTC
jgi:signal transduction protein with GAF and PtsI domain